MPHTLRSIRVDEEQIAEPAVRVGSAILMWLQAVCDVLGVLAGAVLLSGAWGRRRIVMAQ